LKPADEASQNPALAALLDRIRATIASRNIGELEMLMAPKFRVEFDVGEGPKKFHSHWHPDAPSTQVWPMLARLFAMGGTFYSDTLFAVPYVYTRFPLDLNLLEYVVALKQDVSLLEKPERGAKQIGKLAYSIVPLAEPLKPPVLLAPDSYLEVRLPGTGRSFVAAADVYSPAAHRAFFEKRQGEWRWFSLASATLKDPRLPKGALKG